MSEDVVADSVDSFNGNLFFAAGKVVVHGTFGGFGSFENLGGTHRKIPALLK